MQVENMTSSNGNKVPNQLVIRTKSGAFFQSYETIIAFRPMDDRKKTVLNKDYWDYSATTGKYRNKFLAESIKETRAKINAGEYELLSDAEITNLL